MGLQKQRHPAQLTYVCAYTDMLMHLHDNFLAAAPDPPHYPMPTYEHTSVYVLILAYCR